MEKKDKVKEICHKCKQVIQESIFTLASEREVRFYHQKCFIKVKLERNIEDFSKWGS